MENKLRRTTNWWKMKACSRSTLKWVDSHYIIKSYKNNLCSAAVWLHNNLRGGLPLGPLVRPDQQLGGDQTGRPEVRL